MSLSPGFAITGAGPGASPSPGFAITGATSTGGLLGLISGVRLGKGLMSGSLERILLNPAMVATLKGEDLTGRGVVASAGMVLMEFES